MTTIGPNLVLRFLLELAALAGIGVGVAHLVLTPVISIIAAVVAVAAAATVWGLFRSPRARFPLPWPGRLHVEVVVMGAGAAGWAIAGLWIVGAALGALEVVSGTINLLAEERAAERSARPRGRDA